MLNKEYPAPTPKIRNIVVSICFGVFIGFFLYFFEPFDINITSGTHSPVSMFLYGLISAVTLIIFFYLLPLIFPNLFSDSHWKVKHQLFYSLIILFFISTFNGLYTNHSNSFDFSWSNYWWMINRTFVLGGIPFSFLILFDYYRKLASNQHQALEISANRKTSIQSDKSKTVNISTDLKSETISFEENLFSHAIADGNYIDLFSFVSNKLICKTYRISLASFENQTKCPNFKRCHRSYIVNLDKVVSVSGNAQGLRLTLSDKATIIPVSRKYIPIVKQYFTNANRASLA